MKNQISGWRTNAVIAAIVAISVILYLAGSPPWVFAIAALMIFAYFLGQYFRAKPNIRVWRLAYIMGFACWIDLAWVFGLVGLIIAFPSLGAYLMMIPVFPRFFFELILGFIVGAFVGEYVGRRRGYGPLNLP